MNKKAIICIDDEQIILDALETQLRRKFGKDFYYEFAESAEEALEIIDELIEEGYTIVMIISDQIMPGMTGDQFLINVHKKHPAPIKMLLTGQASMESAVNAINNANLYRYLTKPWSEEDLLLTVDKGLEQYYLMEDLRKQANVFQKFVPKQFLDLLSIDELKDIQPKQAKQLRMTIIFTDIRDFTPFSESITPQENFNFLNNYFSHMGEPIEKNNGFVDKYLGDGLMILFQKPTDALQAAIEMQDKVDEYNSYRSKMGYVPIRIGIGCNTGDLVIGIVGSAQRIDSTVVGDAVNMSARIESLTKQYKIDIIISEDTYRDLGTDHTFKIREIDFVCLVGIERPVRIYEVFDKDSVEVIAKKEAVTPVFDAALKSYRAQDWNAALSGFEKCLQICPEDTMVPIYQKRCAHHKLSPPEKNWDGSSQIEQK